MPEFVANVNGGKETLYRQSEVTARYAHVPVDAWTEPSPNWLMGAKGWTEPRFAYKRHMMIDWSRYWELLFRAPAPAAAKLLFWEIFTDGMGPLTGEEVREAERRAGVMINDSTAVREYNTWQATNQKLYGGPVTPAELAELLGAGRERFVRVHDWLTLILEAEPSYFRFETQKVLSEDVQMIEDVPHWTVREIGPVETIGIALEGPHGLKRDVFNLTQFLGGLPNPAADGKRAMQLPGRDRAFRVIGTSALDVTLAAPHLVVSSLQVSQAQEGRTRTLPRSPVVPGWVWDLNRAVAN